MGSGYAEGSSRLKARVVVYYITEWTLCNRATQNNII